MSNPGFGSSLLHGSAFSQLFPEIAVERAYLLSSLNVQNYRATDFIRQIPRLELSLLGNGTPSQKTKTRKHIGWLKIRFEEASWQEHNILQRLRQLTWEAHQRERLVLLDNETFKNSEYDAAKSCRI